MCTIFSNDSWVKHPSIPSIPIQGVVSSIISTFATARSLQLCPMWWRYDVPSAVSACDWAKNPLKKWRRISKGNSPRLNIQNPENWLEEVFLWDNFLRRCTSWSWNIFLPEQALLIGAPKEWQFSGVNFSKKYDTKRPSWSCREMGGNFSQLEVDLERGASDVGEEFVPQINSGYFSTKNAPTEVWGWWMLRLWPRKNHQWLGGCF